MADLIVQLLGSTDDALWDTEKDHCGSMGHGSGVPSDHPRR